MKTLKVIIQEMGIDINDVKILINAGFQYLKKTCCQWVKDHPIVSGVLLFFYLLYIFFPSLFSILFYTFPLVICCAILLGGPRFSLEKYQNNTKKDNAGSTSSIVCDFTSIDRNRNNSHCPNLQTQMSRRTRGRSNDNVILNKAGDKKASISTGVTPSRSDTESQSEEDEPQGQGKNKLLVEWTEDDQQNLMDLGSSELERNKRLESLIAKRKARKLYSMQPRRNNHYKFDVDDYLDNQVKGSILVSRGGIEDGEHQPGSAPSVLLPTRNPFDLPYDPHEEKPILTGGSFDEEFYPDEQHRKEDFFSNNNEISLMGEFKDGHVLPSLFTKPRVVSDSPGLTRFRRESDVEERINEIADELFLREVQQTQNHVTNDDEASTSRVVEEEEHICFENPFAIKSKSTSPNEPITSPRDEVQPTQDHVVLSDYKGRVDDDNDDSSSSSSSEVTNFDAAKNEAFRNSVRKVLTCLAFPRNKGLLVRENMDATTPNERRDLLACVTSPTNSIPTKMQERSIYTKPHHTSNFSIASDMQVEVSEAGSPTLVANEASSPTDQESYDGDVDKDVNSGDDEELWGASPHPTKLGEFGMNLKLHDIEEKEYRGSKLSNVVHNNKGDSPPPTLVSRQVEAEGGGHQAATIGVVSSLSPRSILPDEDMKNDVVDVKSTNGDIMECRSSSSSSSEVITSQMQSKTEHLEVYLASLPASESAGSNILEDMESCHVRDSSAEGTMQDEMNPIFEVDQNEEESKESNNLDVSHGSSEESTITSQIKEQEETSSTFNENIGELNKEHVDQDSSAIQQNDHSRRIQGEGKPISANENFEVITSPNEAISDSFSSTLEDVTEQSRLGEDTKNTLQTDQGQYCDESTSHNNVAAEINHDIDHSNNTKGDERKDDMPQLASGGHIDMVSLPSLTEVVNQNNLSYEQAKLQFLDW